MLRYFRNDGKGGVRELNYEEALWVGGKTLKGGRMIFKVDPNDFVGMCKIMDEYGDEPLPFSGTNENGERVLIGVCHDSISVETFQHNGWVRTNIYNRYGENEELYERP